MTFDVVIVGGGISGLATAYQLKRQGRRVVVLERQVRPGGNAVSERVGGFLMEHGPSTVAAASTVASGLSRELGIDGERCGLGSGVRRRYLVGGGALRDIPIHPLGFLLSNYMSLKGRLWLLAEIVVPPGDGGEEETVADFCTRRFGRELAERVIDPLVGGLYAGRASELSVSAVFPRLVELERDHGSVSYGLLRQRARGGRMPGSRLFSWRRGLGTLPRALSRELGAAVRTGVVVRRIRHAARRFTVDGGPAGTIETRAVILATQAHVAAQLLGGLEGDAAAAAGEIHAPPLAVVFLGYRREQVEHPLDGLGFLAPHAEGRHLTGAQFCSTMFPGRAPDGFVAVAAFIGGARAPDLARLPPADLVDLGRSEFRELIGARGEPVVARVRHWPRGLPQYRLGHERLVTAVRAVEQSLPGLFVTGNYLVGPSVAACLDQACETSRRAHKFLLGTVRPIEPGEPSSIWRVGRTANAMIESHVSQAGQRR